MELVVVEASGFQKRDSEYRIMSSLPLGEGKGGRTDLQNEEICQGGKGVKFELRNLVQVEVPARTKKLWSSAKKTSCAQSCTAPQIGARAAGSYRFVRAVVKSKTPEGSAVRSQPSKSLRVYRSIANRLYLRWGRTWRARATGNQNRHPQESERGQRIENADAESRQLVASQAPAYQANEQTPLQTRERGGKGREKKEQCS